MLLQLIRYNLYYIDENEIRLYMFLWANHREEEFPELSRSYVLTSQVCDNSSKTCKRRRLTSRETWMEECSHHRRRCSLVFVNTPTKPNETVNYQHILHNAPVKISAA